VAGAHAIGVSKICDKSRVAIVPPAHSGHLRVRIRAAIIGFEVIGKAEENVDQALRSAPRE
jgi:hypothetical protein